MNNLTDRHLDTLRTLMVGRTVTPDRAGLVEVWATVGNDWATWGYIGCSNRYPVAGLKLADALAAMRNDVPAWAETVRRLEGK